MNIDPGVLFEYEVRDGDGIIERLSNFRGATFRATTFRNCYTNFLYGQGLGIKRLHYENHLL